ncbi:MAG: restriction endonuclease subunit S [Oscillospiraceae bacterium]|nr:restriction endonuclease subunit S [Oscillospiraceae bacterium]
MRAMKDSGIEWIGEIPQEWSIRRIKHLANGEENSFSDGDWIDSPYISDEGIRYLTTGNIGDGVYKDQGKGYITKETFEKLKCIYAFPGDLVFSRLNTPYGRSCILPSFFPEYVIAVDNVILRTDEEKRYLCYLTQCHGYQHIVEEKANGTTMKRVSRTELGNVYLPIPDRREQGIIADFLNTKCAKIDALIAAKEKTNALLKEHRQSIIFEAVTKGLDPTVPMKDSGVEWIGEIPEGWQVAPLKYFASIRSGFTLGKKYDSEIELREYPYLRVANVQGEYTNLENVTTIQMPAAEAEQYKLKAGELLMTEGGDRDKLGRGSIWHGEIPDCLHQNHVFALSTDERMSIEYLDYLTASDVGRNYFDYTAVKTTNLASTNATTILNFKIPIPSIEEQRDIVACLKQKCTDIDRIIQKNNNTIQKLNEYRQSLIYEAVTGKIEI